VLGVYLDQCSLWTTSFGVSPSFLVAKPATGYEMRMARTVEEIMTRDPRTVDAGDPIVEAARAMRDADIGDVVVTQDGQASGIVTDRDIVVRGIAEGRDPESTPVSEVCTTGIETIEPGASVDDALRVMREHDIRRLPVVSEGSPVGILSLGDLAVEREPDSTLADISAASPDQ
jgi:CBS domain-containing protein